MKKIGLFLLAVVMGIGGVGMTGCSNDDDKLTAADMAGTYTLTKVTDAAGVDRTSEAGSSTLTLTSDGSVTINDMDGVNTGTFTFVDPDLVITSNGDVTPGVGSNGGKTITFTIAGEGIYEFTKS